MKVADILKDKNIRVIEIPKWGTFLQNQWEDHFANHLSLEEKKDIYLRNSNGVCGYLWHLFSYGKRDCLQGKEAEEAFDNEHKGLCYIFWQQTDDALILENAGALNAKDLNDAYDIYVMDQEFNWTYVNTHETGFCGPYFSRRDKTV